MQYNMQISYVNAFREVSGFISRQLISGSFGQLSVALISGGLPHNWSRVKLSCSVKLVRPSLASSLNWCQKRKETADLHLQQLDWIAIFIGHPFSKRIVWTRAARDRWLQLGRGSKYFRPFGCFLLHSNLR